MYVDENVYSSELQLLRIPDPQYCASLVSAGRSVDNQLDRDLRLRRNYLSKK